MPDVAVGCGRRRARRRAPSRRLRPVRVRKTSSSVGRATSAARDVDPAGVEVAQQARQQRRAAAAPGRDGARRRRRRSCGAARCARWRRDRRGVGLGRRRSSAMRSPASSALSRCGRVVGDDPAVVDHDHPLGHGVGLVEVVRGEHDRGAVLGAQPHDVLREVGPVLRIEAGGRLVEEQQLRPVHQPEGDVEPAPLPARQRADRAVGELRRGRATSSSSSAARRGLAAGSGRRRGPG